MKKQIFVIWVSFIILLSVIGRNGLAQTPSVFTEVGTSYGVALNHDTFGAVWLDYDQDKQLDLLTAPQWGTTTAISRLYRNLGNKTFVELAESVGLTEQVNTNNIGLGDYDNDGDIDLLLANNLFRNDISQTGQFTFIGQYGSTFVDYDNDGKLDIFFHEWGVGGKLYRNTNGTFTEVPGALGLNSDVGHVRSVHWIDYNRDGNLDLLLIHGRGERPTLYCNTLQTTGIFTDVTEVMGLGNAGRGYANGGSWGDYDNDGDLDLYIAAYALYGDPNRLYRNDGNRFTETTTTVFENDYSIIRSDDSRHATWWDYDNDGDLDLYVVNNEHFPNRLYRNDIREGKGFVLTNDMADQENGQGGSAGDFDSDGDLDYYLAVTGTNRLYLNSSSANGNHWLSLQLMGTQSNRSGIGATIEVVAGDLKQLRQITSDGFYGLHNSFPVHIGLGNHTIIDSLTITWPSGAVQVIKDAEVDQVLNIQEPHGADAFAVIFPPQYDSFIPPSSPERCYNDLAFNTRVFRVTNTIAIHQQPSPLFANLTSQAAKDAGLYATYASYPHGKIGNSEIRAFNQDSSLFIAEEREVYDPINGKGSNICYLYNGQTGMRIGELGRGKDGFLLENLRWSRDPVGLYKLNTNNTIAKYTLSIRRDQVGEAIGVSLGEPESLNIESTLPVKLPGPEGDLSANRRYWVLAKSDAAQNLTLFVYDLEMQQIVAESPFSVPSGNIDYAAISPRGDAVIVDWTMTANTGGECGDTHGGIEVFNLNKNWQCNRIYIGHNHWEIGIVDQKEVLYTTVGSNNPDGNFLQPKVENGVKIGIGDVIAIRLEDGIVRRLLDVPRDEWSYSLFSVTSQLNDQGEPNSDNYVYVAFYGTTYTPPEPWKPFLGEIVKIPTDGSEAITRLIHHRTRKILYAPDNNTAWQPDFVVNQDGSKIVFQSNFGNPGHDLYLFTPGDTAHCQKVISTTSGTIASPDGIVTITFPAGATAQDIYLSLAPLDDAATPDANSGVTRVGTGYEITATNISGDPVTQFAQPITLTFRYDPNALDGVNASTLSLNYYDEQAQVWTPLLSTVDTEQQTVTTTTSHLTKFAIFGLRSIVPDPTITPGINVPEPATFLLFSGGLISLMILGWRKLRRR